MLTDNRKHRILTKIAADVRWRLWGPQGAPPPEQTVRQQSIANNAAQGIDNINRVPDREQLFARAVGGVGAMQEQMNAAYGQRSTPPPPPPPPPRAAVRTPTPVADVAPYALRVQPQLGARTPDFKSSLGLAVPPPAPAQGAGTPAWTGGAQPGAAPSAGAGRMYNTGVAQ